MGVSKYRLEWPAKAVQELTGWDVHLYTPDEVNYAVTRSSAYLKGVDLKGLDVVVTSRPQNADLLRIVRELQRIGIAVVIDMDDDLSSIHRHSASWKYWNGRGTRGVHYRWAAEACRIADLVTVTTKALEQRYADHGRCEVLPNRVPDNAHEWVLSKTQDGPFTILWSGSVKAHRGDLEAVGRAVKHAYYRWGARVRVAGPEAGVAEALGVPRAAVTGTGWTPIDKWHETVAREAAYCDVAIVPLDLGQRFNKSKSYLKGMEFFAAGLPVIASATQPYKEFASHGGPVTIAADENEWLKALRRARSMHDSGLRGQLQAGVQEQYRKMLDHYTISTGAQGWADAWARAVERRRRLKR